MQFFSRHSKFVINKTITTTEIIVKLCGFVAFQLMSKPFQYIGIWPLCYVIVFFMKYCRSNKSGWHWVAGCCWLLEIKQTFSNTCVMSEGKVTQNKCLCSTENVGWGTSSQSLTYRLRIQSFCESVSVWWKQNHVCYSTVCNSWNLRNQKKKGKLTETVLQMIAFILKILRILVL